MSLGRELSFERLSATIGCVTVFREIWPKPELFSVADKTTALEPSASRLEAGALSPHTAQYP
jgi:hypothetical protein